MLLWIAVFSKAVKLVQFDKELKSQKKFYLSIYLLQ